MNHRVKVKGYILTEGDIIIYNNYKARIVDLSTNNGIGIMYIEGPKINWEDWVVNPDYFTFMENENESAIG